MTIKLYLRKYSMPKTDTDKPVELRELLCELSDGLSNEYIVQHVIPLYPECKGWHYTIEHEPSESTLDKEINNLIKRFEVAVQDYTEIHTLPSEVRADAMETYHTAKSNLIRFIKENK